MLPRSTILTFYAAVLAIQLVTGPDMLLVIGRGICQGRRTALMSAMGMTLVAGFIQVFLLALGIASLVQASPFALELLRWVGAAYLLWLGGRLLLGAGRRGRSAAVARSISDVAALRQGTINNLTNPKALAFLFCLPASVC